MLLGYNYIESLLKIVKKYNVNLIEIYSNLSLLNEKYIKLFKEYNVQVATSFYSQNSEKHDKITGIIGSQKKTLDSLDLLYRNNVKFRIGIVMMNENIAEKDTLRKWLNERYNLNDSKNFDIVRPIGRADNNALIPQKEFNEKFLNTTEILNAQNFNSYYYNKKFNSCWGDKVCLKPDGKIYPCVMSNISFGNYKDVLKILSNKNSYRFLTKDKIKRCKNCEKRYLCFECRAMLSKTKHDLKITPYLCTYDIKTSKFKNKRKVKYE